MILLCAEGLQSKEVAARLGVHEHTVGKWRRRFVKDRMDGLTDEYRPGRPRTVSDAQVAEVIERTLQSTPKDATRWSIRTMAAETGLSHTTIRRIWTAFGLQPHRSETFRLSTDPLFVPSRRCKHRLPVNGQGSGYCRVVFVAAQPGYRAVRGREIANPGVGPRATRAAPSRQIALQSPAGQ